MTAGRSRRQKCSQSESVLCRNCPPLSRLLKPQRQELQEILKAPGLAGSGQRSDCGLSLRVLAEEFSLVEGPVRFPPTYRLLEGPERAVLRSKETETPRRHRDVPLSRVRTKFL